MNFTFQSRTNLKPLLAAIVLGVGAIALAAPAAARMGGGMGGFHGGIGGGGMGGFGGFHPPIFMHQSFSPGSTSSFRPGFNSGLSPGFAGRPFMGNRMAFGNRPFFHDHDHFDHHRNAFAFGLVSGAVLGGLAYDYSYYGYPYDSYPYYGAAYGDDCYLVYRRVVNPWGHVVLRRVAVCDQ
jgi:hypothetical protein